MWKSHTASKLQFWDMYPGLPNKVEPFSLCYARDQADLVNRKIFIYLSLVRIYRRVTFGVVKPITFGKMILRRLFLVCMKWRFADVQDRMQVNVLHSSGGPCPISKPPRFTCLLSRSKHTFVKLFQDVSKVQFCFIVTVNPNHLMLISHNLLHCQLSS